MSFEGVGQALAERFRKTGQLTLKDLKSAIANISEDHIPPEQLVALIACLHIIAQIPLVNSSDTANEEEYIMPCVLENTNIKELDLFHKESSRSCFVEPLLVHFTSGFTPMGLFSAFIACLISFIFLEKESRKHG